DPRPLIRLLPRATSAACPPPRCPRDRPPPPRRGACFACRGRRARILLKGNPRRVPPPRIRLKGNPPRVPPPPPPPLSPERGRVWGRRRGGSPGARSDGTVPPWWVSP